eukprot:maker-scaffold_1-snap-gene-4.20-mRNA-1 protein AED:0.01 eAED:0.01 QI:77/1/1/1/1/1/2/168/486
MNITLPRMITSTIRVLTLKRVLSLTTSTARIKKSSSRKAIKLEKSSFFSLDLNPLLCASLLENGFSKPTSVQQKFIPEYLNNISAHYIISSSTGSGKTLAFLLPIIHQMKQSEIREEGFMPAKEDIARPKVVIVSPTRELSHQIASVCKMISHEVKFSTVSVIGGKLSNAQKLIRKRDLNKYFDVLVTTPDALLKNWKAEKLFLSKMEHLVLDEADTLLGKNSGFETSLNEILPKFIGKKAGLKTTFVGATVGKRLKELGRDQTTSSLHAIQKLLKLPKEQLNFIEVEDSGSEIKLSEGSRVRFFPCRKRDKKPELCRLISNSEAKRIIVFCNAVDSARAVDYILNDLNMDLEEQFNILSLHAAMPPRMRQEAYRNFSNASDERKLLICTDIAARGLDLEVDEVVIFDLPSSVTDFVHRAGRTGRVSKDLDGENKRGRVSVLVGNSTREKRLQKKLQMELQLPDPYREMNRARKSNKRKGFTRKNY